VTDTDPLIRRLGFLVAPSVPGRCARSAGTYDQSGACPKRDYPCHAYRELACVETCPFDRPEEAS
jgi:hypothetical protein